MGAQQPLVTLHLTPDEASVGAVSKTQLGKGRVGSSAFRNRLVGCGSAWWWLILIALAILRREWRVLSSRSPSSPPQQSPRLWFLSSLAATTTTTFTRLSFNCCCRSSLNTHEVHHHTSSSTHINNYTFKMKYQLIALPALAATVAAQDMYVDTFFLSQSISTID